MANLNQTKAISPWDGLLEYVSDLYSIEAGAVKNTHIGAVTITKSGLIGMPVLFNDTTGQVELVAAASINTANAVIIEATGDITALAAAGVSAVKATVVRRGPAILRKSLIRATDAAGAAITLATVITALRAVSPPILLANEPATIVTQAT